MNAAQEPKFTRARALDRVRSYAIACGLERHGAAVEADAIVTAFSTLSEGACLDAVAVDRGALHS